MRELFATRQLSRFDGRTTRHCDHDYTRVIPERSTKTTRSDGFDDDAATTAMTDDGFQSVSTPHASKTMSKPPHDNRRRLRLGTSAGPFRRAKDDVDQHDNITRDGQNDILLRCMYYIRNATASEMRDFYRSRERSQTRT